MRIPALAATAVLAALAVLPLRAATSFDRYVDLQLVLAVDISGSMDYIEQQVQRDGYVSAFRDPAVVKAITSGPYGRIAVTYVRWAGAFVQETAVPWMIIGSKSDAEAFAAAIYRAPLYTERGTSISSALTYSFGTFAKSGVDSDRRTIDVSGDGSNNDGLPVEPIREKILASNITINGLPVMINPSGVPGSPFLGLEDYYRDCVIGGPTSFVVPIKKLDEFAPAIRRKLILEIAWAPPREPVVPVSSLVPAPKVNCALVDRSTINNFFP
jgi:hypothetical protein